MPNLQYQCKNPRRKMALYRLKDENGLPALNGIDYLEVSADRQTLLVYCIHPVINANLTIDNFQIIPIDQLRGSAISVESISINRHIITLGIRATPDRQTYNLQAIDPAVKLLAPAPGFDPKLFQVEFSWGIDDISEFDCEVLPPVGDRPLPPPTIDYLAKDYSSFRQLMLDRLAVTMPEWRERSPADLGVMVVELVAYSADYLSYYQDAVATEAYLGTARKRVSMRRHARLLNYPMHDGSNARAWLVLQVEKPMQLQGPIDPERDRLPYPGTRFLTKRPNLPTVLNDKQFKTATNEGAIIFEAMQNVAINPVANEIHFYTWGDGDCYLPKGATQATLKDPDRTLSDWLKLGNILMLEEVGINTPNLRIDPNPAHRHPVMITEMNVLQDPIFDQQVIEINWGIADRLPFDLIISQTVGDQEIPYSVVHGNVVLVDAGRTINHPADADEQQDLDPNTADSSLKRLRERVVRLTYGPVTQQGKIRNRSGKLVPINFDRDLNPQAAAADAVNKDLMQIMPAVILVEEDTERQEKHYWYPQRDLLNSDHFAREFVVEIEDDSRAYLRFGDGNSGRKPKVGIKLSPIYRVGNGMAGNVGAESIAHIYDDRGLPDFVPKEDIASINNSSPIRNPLPAQGGVEPESIEQVRLNAPHFRTLQRAVTEADYAEIVQRFPGVSKALATRRWTGSWYTIFITVDRLDGLPVNEEFKAKLSDFLEPFRLTGHDVAIEEPRFVPLDLSITVQVKPGYFRSEVKAALVLAFSVRLLPDGQLAFFHPDNFSFGQPLYLSKVIEKAMQVAGVQSLVVDRFQRRGLPAQKELETGRISCARLEIVLLDNSANRPGLGKIEFMMEGGL
jgi:hypothetical protein